MARVAAMAEMAKFIPNASTELGVLFNAAVADERRAFKDWQDTMRTELGLK